jgi:voltage-gated potassium channel
LKRSSLAVALEQFGPYDLYMLALSLFALGLLAAQTLLVGDGEVENILEYTDTGLCILFFADFVRNVIRSPNRLRYLVHGGWLDLISSFPTVALFRVGRIGRVARIVRVMRAMRSVRTIGSIVAGKRHQSALLAAAIVAILMIFFSSVAILQFERLPDSNIRSAGDALWWAFATITTVGYGDLYPVTLEGRIVAAALMAAGVGLFGLMSGMVASWFLNVPVSPEDSDTAALREDIALLRAEIAVISRSNPDVEIRRHEPPVFGKH